MKEKLKAVFDEVDADTCPADHNPSPYVDEKFPDFRTARIKRNFFNRASMLGAVG
jgi:hypothetical protein